MPKKAGKKRSIVEVLEKNSKWRKHEDVPHLYLVTEPDAKTFLFCAECRSLRRYTPWTEHKSVRQWEDNHKHDAN